MRDTHIACETLCHGVSASDSAFHAQSRVLQDPVLTDSDGELPFDYLAMNEVFNSLTQLASIFRLYTNNFPLIPSQQISGILNHI